jgi:hypothetical protein
LKEIDGKVNWSGIGIGLKSTWTPMAHFLLIFNINFFFHIATLEKTRRLVQPPAPWLAHIRDGRFLISH